MKTIYVAHPSDDPAIVEVGYEQPADFIPVDHF